MKNKLRLITQVKLLIVLVIISNAFAGSPLNSVNVPSTSIDDPTSINIVYACGDSGLVIKTTNGGVNWCRMIIDTRKNLNSIFFVNQTTGWIVGDSCSIFKNSDGISWISQAPSFNTTISLRSVYFININTGWAVGDSGMIIWTNNGGTSWNLQFTDSSKTRLNSVFFIGTDGWIVGNLAGGYSRILYTSNSGVNWTYQVNPSINNLNGVYFVFPNLGFAVGDNGTAIKTMDGGTTWFLLTTSQPAINFKSVAFLSAAKGYGVGTLGRITQTTDAGASWSFISNGVNTLNSVAFDSAGSGGYTVGNESSIYKSTNPDTNLWEPQSISSCVISVEQISSATPKNFFLYQNYPNPFNPSTKIKFDLRKSSYTKISIYDITGNLVTVLVDENLKVGTFYVEWDAGNYSSGVYFVKLETPEFTQSRKILLIK